MSANMVCTTRPLVEWLQAAECVCGSKRAAQSGGQCGVCACGASTGAAYTRPKRVSAAQARRASGEATEAGEATATEAAKAVTLQKQQAQQKRRPRQTHPPPLPTGYANPVPVCPSPGSRKQ